MTVLCGSTLHWTEGYFHTFPLPYVPVGWWTERFHTDIGVRSTRYLVRNTRSRAESQIPMIPMIVNFHSSLCVRSGSEAGCQYRCRRGEREIISVIPYTDQWGQPCTIETSWMHPSMMTYRSRPGSRLSCSTYTLHTNEYHPGTPLFRRQDQLCRYVCM